MNSLSNSIHTCTIAAVEQFAELVAVKFSLSKTEILELWNNNTDPSLKVLEISPKTKGATTKPKARAEEVESGQTCSYDFKKGNNAGKKCPAKVSDETGFCRKHQEKETKSEVSSPKDATKSEKTTKPKAKATTKATAVDREVAKPVIKAVVKDAGKLNLVKNTFGNFEHKETGLVFDQSSNAFGRQVKSEVVPLTAEDIDTCKKFSFKYIQPTAMTSSAVAEESDEESVTVDDEDEEEEESEEDE